MANDKDTAAAAAFKAAMDECERKNNEKFAQAKAEGKTNAQALEVIDLTAEGGGVETDALIFDHAAESIRQRILEGKVKLVVICACVAGDDEDKLEGITEVLTTSTMLDNRSLALMVENNIPVRMAENVTQATHQALFARVKAIADYFKTQVAKAKEN